MINSHAVESSQILQYSAVSVLSSISFNHYCVHHEDTFQLFLPFQLTFPVCLMCFIRISFIWSWSHHVTCLFKIHPYSWFHPGFCACQLFWRQSNKAACQSPNTSLEFQPLCLNLCRHTDCWNIFVKLLLKYNIIHKDLVNFHPHKLLVLTVFSSSSCYFVSGLSHFSCSLFL